MTDRARITDLLDCDDELMGVEYSVSVSVGREESAKESGLVHHAVRRVHRVETDADDRCHERDCRGDERQQVHLPV